MSESSPTLRHYVGFLRRQAWLILLTTTIAILAAVLVVSRQDVIHRASMGIIVAQGGGEATPQIGNRALTQTMTNILESDVIAQRVVDDLDLPITSAALLKKLNVSVKPDSSIMTVSYDSTDKQQAVAVLTSTGQQFLSLIQEKLGVSGRLRRPGPLQIIADIYDPPHLEPNQVSPQPAKTIGFAAALGLALGLILGFARESLDDRVRSRRDAEEWFGAPVIGALPTGMRRRPPSLVGETRWGRSKGAQAVDILRANLQFAASGPAGPTLAVTSALPNEGKSTVVASLGMALAVAGKDVIVVESDLRRPSLHSLLHVPAPELGLDDVIEGRATLSDALQDAELLRTGANGRKSDASVGAISDQLGTRLAGRLRLLPAGPSAKDPTAVLSPDRVARLMNDARELASYVIFDCPPILLSSEAVPLAVNADSVVVVARQGFTTRRRAEDVRRMLEKLGAENVSVVLVDSREALRVAPY